MPSKSNYTLPKIKSKGDKWYVWFRFYNEETKQRELIIKTAGANFPGQTNTERLERLQQLKKAIQFKLERQGWNPITNTYPQKTAKEINLEKLQSMTLNDALDFALSKCALAKKTKLGYAGSVRFFQLAGEQLGVNQFMVTDIKRHHVKLILEQIKTERKWSNHAFNKHLGYIAAVIDRLIEWEILEVNPAHKIKSLPVAETQKYEPYTAQEKKIITDYLYVNHYRFFVFLMVVYHTGIRPKEALALRISDLNEGLTEIKIVPDLDEENSKTKKIRRVPINGHLQSFFREMKLNEYPSEYFLFGSPFTSGRGNSGSTMQGRGANHPDYFKPSTTRIKRDTVTKLWKKIVKDKLKIDKYQYAMKHTGADDKILAGIDLDALRELYGHSSKYMTEKYARQVREIYKQQIVDMSPAF